MQNSMLILNSSNKYKIAHPKKVIAIELLHTAHIFSFKTLIAWTFATFSTGSKLPSNSALFDTHVEFFQINCIVSNDHFLQTLKRNAHKTARKNGKTFSINVS